MKTRRTPLVAGLVLVAVAAITGVAVFKRHAAPEPTRQSAKLKVESRQTENQMRSVVTHVAVPGSSSSEKLADAPQTESAKASPQANPKSPSAASKTTQAQKPKKELKDPVARVAMSLVGVDPDAEAYWLEAIFDSSLPDQEREDLIEDLNEEGLSDPKRPGPEDFPLIMIRLKRIEEIAPFADDFMLIHLREAHKDLWNLAEISQGGGKPVR